MKVLSKITLLFIFLTAVIGCKEQSMTKGSDESVYSCTMHHQVREKRKGPCPVCGMDMVVVPDINNW
jgi:Cu(I)/Ag(I) efflux system membrane fusion protein